tara:strand:+ start:754 stop:1035 length:282 start_codon:yes stop_codon:yes gene_type:complete
MDWSVASKYPPAPPPPPVSAPPPPPPATHSVLHPVKAFGGVQLYVVYAAIKFTECGAPVEAVFVADVSVPHVYVPAAVSEYTYPAVAAAVIDP